MTFVSVPQVEPEQPLPERLQLTPRFDGSFETVAVKDVECDTWTETLVALREIESCRALLEPELTRPAQETSPPHDNRARATLNLLNEVASKLEWQRVRIERTPVIDMNRLRLPLNPRFPGRAD